MSIYFVVHERFVHRVAILRILTRKTPKHTHTQTHNECSFLLIRASVCLRVYLNFPAAAAFAKYWIYHHHVHHQQLTTLSEVDIEQTNGEEIRRTAKPLATAVAISAGGAEVLLGEQNLRLQDNR